MRIAVVPLYEALPDSSKKLLLDTAAAVAAVLQAQGHIAEIIDFNEKPGARLGGFQALFFGFSVPGLMGRIPESIRNKFLADAGSIAGKRAWVFVMKRLFANLRLELDALSFLEKEGAIIRNSFVLSGPGDAKALVERVQVAPS